MINNTSNQPLPNDLQPLKVGPLPIISHFCRQIGIVDLVNKHIPSPENIDSGDVVLAMIMDTLTGRSPLYKLTHNFAHDDVPLLFGKDINNDDFNDHNVGKVLDRIHQYGASQLFSQISFRAFDYLELSHEFFHFDTTSVNVWGAYNQYQTQEANKIAIVHGHSKDKRPDLKQFLYSCLCAGGNIPLLGAVCSGNQSDKKTNNQELTRIASFMKKHKLDPLASIYIADSAFVTKENLDKAEQNQLDVISRLPATYAEEQRVITLSMQHPDKWIEIGSLQDTVVGKETARYRYQEQCVDLYGKEYRAIVIHSSSHDKRRQKKLERALLLEEQKLNKKIKALEKQKFHCCEDAKNTTEKDISGCNLKYHQTRIEIEEIKSNKRGRPRKGQEPETGKIEYCVKVLLIRDEESIQKLKEQSGCFVLITTVNPNRHDGKTILQAYKQQNGVEMNFRFLKDPLIVNDTFLKKAERIEALGVILLLSLMIWNLIQHLLRRYINQNEENSIEGWDKKQTRRPTTAMVTYHFEHILIFRWHNKRLRKLGHALSPTQRKYLQILGLNELIFTQFELL